MTQEEKQKPREIGRCIFCLDWFNYPKELEEHEKKHHLAIGKLIDSESRGGKE